MNEIKNYLWKKFVIWANSWYNNTFEINEEKLKFEQE
jgi:hypothetical protein